MDGSPLWSTILAIVASVLSAGGIASQFIAWKRERDKTLSEERAKALEAEKAKHAGRAEVEKVEVTAKVELAKIEADAEKHERKHTGRFQTLLVDRIANLERKHDENAAEIGRLKDDNVRCQAANTELRAKYDHLDAEDRKLARDHENLKADHAQLREHVARIETENRGLRARLARLDRAAGETNAVEPETVELGARAARRAAGTTKQGE